jgi:hypothetical protein
MTEHSDHIFDELMFAQQIEEEKQAIETLRELGYENPEKALFALRALELRDEKGQT